jgi:predicted helicase
MKTRNRWLITERRWTKNGYIIPTPDGLQFENDVIDEAHYLNIMRDACRGQQWENWRYCIAIKVRAQTDCLTAIINNPDNIKEIETFNAYARELEECNEELINSLVWRNIYAPVHDEFFGGNFNENIMGSPTQAMLDILQNNTLSDDADSLKLFYESVKMCADNVENSTERNNFIRTFYSDFSNTLLMSRFLDLAEQDPSNHRDELLNHPAKSTG